MGESAFPRVSDLAVVFGLARQVFGNRVKVLLHAVDPALRHPHLSELARKTVRLHSQRLLSVVIDSNRSMTVPGSRCQLSGRWSFVSR